MEKHLSFLRSLPLFSGLSEPDILCLLQSLQADEMHFAKQELAWKPFRQPPCICLVLQGCIQLMQEDLRGDRSIIGSFAAGDLLSANALGLEGMQPFCLHAKAGSTLLVFSAADMDTAQEDLREIQLIFLRRLVDTLLRSETQLLHKIECQSRRTTREKILSYLQIQAAKQGSQTVAVDFSRQELADYLCVDRSAMCTELTRMQKDGLIRCRKREFTLLGES